MIIYGFWDGEFFRYHATKREAIKNAKSVPNETCLPRSIEIERIDLGPIDKAKVLRLLSGSGYIQQADIIQVIQIPVRER